MKEEEIASEHTGFRLWRELGRPKMIVAPMVDQSELAWRMLSRKYGAQLCYTPMLHASVFIRNEQYRKDALTSCNEDRPLIVQFCANDPEILLKASVLAQDHCDAVDLNLGCPQAIARRGHYGAFLQDDWDLISKMVSLCHKNLSIPITCKIRIFLTVEKTVRYAKMLENAGCQILTVHGRAREQKGPRTGLADWKYVKAIKNAIKIPVFSNGNIQYFDDVERCIKETGVEGVMVAEGNLHNPALFDNKIPNVCDISLEYLDFVDKYPPCPLSYARGHIFKICVHSLQKHTEIRDKLGNSKSIYDIRTAILELQDICKEKCQKGDSSNDMLPLPHWVCQPYVRPAIRHETEKAQKRSFESSDALKNVTEISKKKLKKLFKKHGQLVNGMTPTQEQIESVLKMEKARTKLVYEKCSKCGNPRGERCVFLYCKSCCKKRTKEISLSCPRHQNNKTTATEFILQKE
ncbi:tRNA-dihydrouridine(16/17) synthase [NAD(P)(+)]-like [Styela clava]